MSLLNAALRKKEKENQHLNASPLFKKTGRLQTKTKILIYGIIAFLAIAIGLAIPYATDILLPKQLSPPLPQLPDIVAAQQDVAATADSFQPGDISHIQEIKQNEAKNNLMDKQTSLLPVQTKNSSVEEKIEKKPDNASKPELSSKSALKKPSAMLSSSGLSPYQATAKHKSIKPFYEKAVRYHRQNRLKEAIVMYRQALAKDPQDRDTLFNLACAYLDNREFAAALPILNDLYEKDPNNPLVMINLAIANIETGEPAMAFTLLDAAQKVTDAPLLDVNFHKAAALSRLGRLDEAKQFYEMAETKDPGNIKLIFNMAVLYDKMKKYQEALLYYRTFLTKNGPSSDKEKKSIEDRVLILNTFIEREQNRIP